jgi:hypothetical protein
MNAQDESPASNILGATGLSKRALASHFRKFGLFGRDSGLSREQQAAVLARMPAIEGLRVPVVNLLANTQLQAIAELTDRLVAGEELIPALARVRGQGISLRVVTEIRTVVADARLVFGPYTASVTRPMPATPTADTFCEAA